MWVILPKLLCKLSWALVTKLRWCSISARRSAKSWRSFLTKLISDIQSSFMRLTSCSTSGMAKGVGGCAGLLFAKKFLDASGLLKLFTRISASVGMGWVKPSSSACVAVSRLCRPITDSDIPASIIRRALRSCNKWRKP